MAERCSKIKKTFYILFLYYYFTALFGSAKYLQIRFKNLRFLMWTRAPQNLITNICARVCFKYNSHRKTHEWDARILNIKENEFFGDSPITIDAYIVKAPGRSRIRVQIKFFIPNALITSFRRGNKSRKKRSRAQRERYPYPPSQVIAVSSSWE